MAGLRDTLASFLTPTSLEEVYLAKYGGRYPSLAENIGVGAGSALKAIGAPEKFAETQGRNIADLLGWSPFGALTAAEEAGQAFEAGDYGGAVLAAAGAIPGAGKAAKPAAKAGREALAAAASGVDELAGMFREGVQPQVPQTPIPRYEPPRGVPARTSELIANPDVRDKVAETVQRGVGMGGAEWYNAEPLRLAFTDELGNEAGTQAFNRYMDMVAATSPRSKVPENVRNASFYYALGDQPLPAKNPEPYGHLAQGLHRMNVERIRGGGFDPMVNPKPVSFAANLQGNQMPVTVDTHAFRLPAVLSQDPRFLASQLQVEPGVSRNIRKEFEAGQVGMDEAAGRPAFWETQPGKNEYAAMERYYQDIGRDLGLTGAQTQSAAWVGGGEQTGLASEATKTFMDFFKDRLLKTAVETKMDPRDVLARFIRGESALRALGGVTLGAGALGGALRPEENGDRL